MSDETETQRSGDFVQSLDRGLAVIRAFTAEHPQLTLSDVARHTGLSRAAARRFLHTLVELGYVGTNGREFSLRPRLLELGHAYLSGLRLPEIATPHLRALSDALGESSSMAVLDNHDIVYVARVAASRIMSIDISVGSRLPAFVTSMGRAIIGCGAASRREEFLQTYTHTAFTENTVGSTAELKQRLDEARERGWVLIDEELEEGLRSIAVPIHDGDGDVVAAVNVSAPARRGGVDRILREILPPLQQAALLIEADLARIHGHR